MFPIQITFSHRFDDTILILRIDYPAAAGFAQQGSNRSRGGQREYRATSLQVFVGLAGNLSDQPFGQ